MLHGEKGTFFNTRSLNNTVSAYQVIQGGVIFSTHQKIGTTNVQNCVAFIIQETASKKNALAHISQVKSRNFINNIVNYLPEGEKQGILVGARHGTGEHAFSQACYDFNTSFGDITVDPQTLTVTPGSPKFSTPCENIISCHDLDKELNEINIINNRGYAVAMVNLCYGIETEESLTPPYAELCNRISALPLAHEENNQSPLTNSQSFVIPLSLPASTKF